MDRATLTDMEVFRITTAKGDQVPLSAVTIIEQDRGFARIQRVNGLRTVTISSDLDTRVTNARKVIEHTRSHFLPDQLERYPELSADSKITLHFQ